MVVEEGGTDEEWSQVAQDWVSVHHASLPASLSPNQELGQIFFMWTAGESLYLKVPAVAAAERAPSPTSYTKLPAQPSLPNLCGCDVVNPGVMGSGSPSGKYSE